jgi:predicted metal-dependent peptidase
VTDQKELTIEEVKEMEEKCYGLLAVARLEVLKRAPYYGSLLYTLVPHMAPGFGTLGITENLILIVDPVRVMQDPELGGLDDKGIPQKLAGALAHELQHVLRGMDRVRSLAKVDPELANIAADLPINADLQSSAWQLPSWGVFPEKYKFPRGETMEQYFERLMKDPEKFKKKTRTIILEAKGKAGNGEPDVCAGGCGGVGGNPSQMEKEILGQLQNQPGGNPGRHQGEVDAAQRNTLEAAKQHFEQTQGRGSTPGWIEDELNKLENRKRDRDWVRELDSVVRRRSGIIMAGGADFSMSRPSRRSLLRGGLLRPGMVEQQMEGAIYIDTSGSMGAEELKYAKNVVCNIMEQTGVDRVWLGQCDAKVHEMRRVKVRDVPALPMKGRGGTNFVPIFSGPHSVYTLKPRPDMVIILTDGDGPAPTTAPRGITVIWVIVPTGYRKPADWGHLVVASNDHELADPYYID